MLLKEAIAEVPDDILLFYVDNGRNVFEREVLIKYNGDKEGYSIAQDEDGNYVIMNGSSVIVTRKNPYPEFLVKKVRYSLYELEDEDRSQDFNIQSLKPRDFFRYVCEYEGMINMHGRLLRWVEQIFKTELD